MDTNFDLPRHASRRLTRPGVTEMLAYWESLRGKAAVPARSQIDPMALQPYLNHAGIAERTDTGAVKLRIGGHTFERMIGVNPRGMPLRALFDVTVRDDVATLFDAVFDGPQVLTMSLIADRRDAPSITAQFALMPLSDMSGRLTRALVACVTDPFQGETPLRFRVRSTHLAPAGGLMAAKPFQPPKRPTRVQVARGDRSFLHVIEGGLAEA